MKHTLTLLTALLLAPLAAIHAADKTEKLGIAKFEGIDPNEGTAATSKDTPPRLIPNPGSTKDYARVKRTCTGVPSIAVSRGGRIWAMWYSGTTPGEIIERCPNAYVVVSTSGDRGKTFTVKGAFEVSYDLKPFEPMLIERKDGSLWMLVRTAQGIGESVSIDGGTSWSPLKTQAIKHTAARFFITRLQSGSLLLVKHSGIDVDPASVGKLQRRDLTAFISKDDGKTWSGGLVIDDRIGCSYPDGQQTADGTIHLIWDFMRSQSQEIVMTTFREEDVLATSAETIARVKSNRRLVSKGGTPE